MEYINSKSKNELTERQKKVINIYNKLNKQNKHKMIPIPVCEIPRELLD
jgi:NAD+ synthase